MSTATLAPPLMTADEFLRLHGDESGIEFIKGQIVRLPMPGALHGEVCVKVSYYVQHHVMQHKLGRVMSNDTFIRVGTNPPSVRGADVCFISYATLPATQPTPRGALLPPLELVVEVRSPSDSMTELEEKATEYLDAGVQVVLIFDPDTDSIVVHRANELAQRFQNGEMLAVPDVLPGFSVPVAKFFE